MSPILRNTQLESRTSGGESRQCECAIFTYQDVNTYLSVKPKRAQDQIIQRSFEIIRMNGKERLVKTQWHIGFYQEPICPGCQPLCSYLEARKHRSSLSTYRALHHGLHSYLCSALKLTVSCEPLFAFLKNSVKKAEQIRPFLKWENVSWQNSMYEVLSKCPKVC